MSILEIRTIQKLAHIKLYFFLAFWLHLYSISITITIYLFIERAPPTKQWFNLLLSSDNGLFHSSCHAIAIAIVTVLFRFSSFLFLSFIQFELSLISYFRPIGNGIFVHSNDTVRSCQVKAQHNKFLKISNSSANNSGINKYSERLPNQCQWKW